MSDIKAPWTDFRGNDLFEGDTIQHPSGQKGVVIFKKDREDAHDQWLVDYGCGFASRLCLQIGDKGQACKVIDELNGVEK